MNLYKTEVMWVGKQRDEVNIRFEDIKQVNNVVYLGGNISENARVDVEVRRIIQARANAWRNIQENSRSKESGETENERPARRSWN